MLQQRQKKNSRGVNAGRDGSEAEASQYMSRQLSPCQYRASIRGCRIISPEREIGWVCKAGLN